MGGGASRSHLSLTPSGLDEAKLRGASAQGDEQTVRALLESRVNIDAVNLGGSSALHLAARAGHDAVLELLLAKRCATADLPDITHGETPLHEAAFWGRTSCVAKLLEAGCKKDLQNKSGESALSCAARMGHHAVVQALAEKANTQTGKAKETGWGDRDLEARERDRDDLLAKLQAASGKEVRDVRDGKTEICSTSGNGAQAVGDKFHQPRMLEYGAAQASTMGLVHFMGVDQNLFYAKLSEGVEAMIREVKDRSEVEEKRTEIKRDLSDLGNLVADGKLSLAKEKQKEIDEKTKEADELEQDMMMAEEVFLYIVHEEAGSSKKTYQNGWRMDCDPETGEVLPDRLVDDDNGGKRGMKVDDFHKHPNSVVCGHSLEEVIAGRFYTTIGFKPVNKPLRNSKRKDPNGRIIKAVSLPVITYHLNEFVKKCRTLAANSETKNAPLDLYRGMSNVCLQDGFMQEGGSELAPMSTTEDLGIALKYSATGNKSVLLRIRTTNFMDRGSSLRWISAFPHEEEYLYPPITYLKPRYDKPEIFKIGDVEYQVVDVTAQMP
jgi:hypothetical protein